MTQIPVYQIVNGNQLIEVLEPPYQGATPVRYYDPNEVEAQRLLAEKQYLLDSIPTTQQRIMGKHSDVWAIKFQDSEYDDDLTAQQKQDNKAFNKKVITWRKTVRAQNNNITTANTKEEIQARLDRLAELEQSYPEI